MYRIKINQRTIFRKCVELLTQRGIRILRRGVEFEVAIIIQNKTTMKWLVMTHHGYMPNEISREKYECHGVVMMATSWYLLRVSSISKVKYVIFLVVKDHSQSLLSRKNIVKTLLFTRWEPILKKWSSIVIFQNRIISSSIKLLHCFTFFTNTTK